jgi:hypothetical protein
VATDIPGTSYKESTVTAGVTYTSCRPSTRSAGAHGRRRCGAGTRRALARTSHINGRAVRRSARLRGSRRQRVASVGLARLSSSAARRRRVRGSELVLGSPFAALRLRADDAAPRIWTQVTSTECELDHVLSIFV